MTLHVYKAISYGYDKELSVCPAEHGVTSKLHVTYKVGDKARLWNRDIKINGFQAYESMSLYLDGSLKARHPLLDLVEEWLSDHDIALFRHPHRTCVYEELKACFARGKLTLEQVDEARRVLKERGVPRNGGLWACGVIARRTNAPHLRELMDQWWKFTKAIPRDQLWLPLVLTEDWRKRVFTIDADIFNNPWFEYRRHA